MQFTRGVDTETVPLINAPIKGIKFSRPGDTEEDHMQKQGEARKLALQALESNRKHAYATLKPATHVHGFVGSQGASTTGWVDPEEHRSALGRLATRCRGPQGGPQCL